MNIQSIISWFKLIFNTPDKDRQKGTTTNDFLLWGGLSVLAFVVIIGGYVIGKSTNTGNTITTMIQQTFSGVHNAVGNGGYGTGNITSAIYTADGFPTTLKPNATTPTAMNAGWGGTVTITGYTSYFTMTITDVADDACIKGVMSVTSGWSSVQVDSGSAESTFPLSLTTAQTMCVVGGNHTMILTGY